MTEGVRLDHLCCPTCGEPYPLPLQVFTVSPECDFDPNQSPGAIQKSPIVPWQYCVECVNGHLWTIKQVTRVRNRPDRVLLGQYIGDD